MAENLLVDKSKSKLDQYNLLIEQLGYLVDGENDVTANHANIIGALKQTFDFFWVGIYRVDESSNQLVLNVYQGPIACTRINYGSGVCGKSWELKEPILVPNVDEFPGHIACSSASKSEVVVPIFKNGEVIGILDVDSDKLDDFDEVDESALTQIAELLGKVA